MIDARNRQQRRDTSWSRMGLRMATLVIPATVLCLTGTTRADDAGLSIPNGGSFDTLVGMQPTPASPEETILADAATILDGDGLVAERGQAIACDPARPCGDGCDPPGFLQKLQALHRSGNACWVGRADGLVLWRDAPPARQLVIDGNNLESPVLNADQLDSPATGGVRASVLRVDPCTGNAWEGTYIYAGTFTSLKSLPAQDGVLYALAPPGIYGNKELQPFDVGNTSLLARLQSAELNRHFAWGPSFRWLAGFRWLQWEEAFALRDTESTLDINDVYATDCINNLYGGQIGADARLLTLHWFRIDSLVKAGAFYNNAVQTSTYLTDDPAFPGVAQVTAGQSPVACSFVGEVGLTGVVSLCRNLDLRVGYFGLWITSLAQPTQQLSGQALNPGPGEPVVGTINGNGGTLVQGVSLGLEGRW